MTFWDAAAIVPLVLDEPSTKALQRLAARDRAMLVWWSTTVECASAVARLERDGALAEPAAAEAFDRFRRPKGGSSGGMNWCSIPWQHPAGGARVSCVLPCLPR